MTVDIQTISVLFTGVSISLAAFYYIMTIRNTGKNIQTTLETRQTDILMRLHSLWGSDEYQKASWTVIELDYANMEEFEEKYGSIYTLTKTNLDIYKVCWFFNGLGVLVHNDLADLRVVEELFGYMIPWMWEILEPIIQAEREHYGQPRSLEWFEYLYNEMRKEQWA